MERILAETPLFCDALGHTVESVATNQKVSITTNLTNVQDGDQAFACLVQITEPNGARTMPTATSGLLSSKQSQIAAIPWTPTVPGRYVVSVYVWESLMDPTALSAQLKALVDVKGSEGGHQQHQMNAKPIADTEVSRLPAVPVIHIPLGTSVPGCEANHNCYVPSSITVRGKQNHRLDQR